MADEGSIFERYSQEQRGLKYRMKQPKFWVNIFLAIAVVSAGILIVKSCRSSWNSGQVKNSIKLAWFKTEWKQVRTRFGKEMVKIVPALSIRIKNSGTQPLQYVDFEAVFSFADSGKTHTSGYSKSLVVPLLPGDESKKIVLTGTNGYTATSIESFAKNKKFWKKLKVKLFARTKGSPPTKIGGVYNVEQTIKKLGDGMGTDSSKKNPLFGMLKIESEETGWIYKSRKTGDVVVFPVIDIKVKNIGPKPIKQLVFSAIFSFEQSGDGKHSGYPIYKKIINPGSVSDTVSLRSDFGIKTPSLQSLYNNILTWEAVKVRIFVKESGFDYLYLDEFRIKKEVRGVRVIKK